MDMTRQDYIEAIQRKCKDEETRLSAADWDDALTDALQIYNRRRPDKALADCVGDGTSFLDVPAAWDADFSRLLRLSELDSRGVPTEIRINRVELDVRPGAAPRLMLPNGYFASGTTYRVMYAVKHTVAAESSSVPDDDAGALTALAASLSCTRLAAAYAQSVDPQVGTITLDYKSKTSDYRNLAKDYMAEFERAVSAKTSVAGRGRLKTWGPKRPLI